MKETKNKNDTIELVIILLMLSIFALVAVWVLSRLGIIPESDFLPFGKGNLVIVEDSITRSVDPFDIGGEIISGKIRNTSIVSVKKAIVTVYFLDYSGVEGVVDTIFLYNIKPKSTVEFKTRLESFMHLYGVSKVYATVSW